MCVFIQHLVFSKQISRNYWNGDLMRFPMETIEFLGSTQTMAIEMGSIVCIPKASSQETLRLKHLQALIQFYAPSALVKSLNLKIL